MNTETPAEELLSKETSAASPSDSPVSAVSNNAKEFDLDALFREVDQTLGQNDRAMNRKQLLKIQRKLNSASEVQNLGDDQRKAIEDRRGKLTEAVDKQRGDMDKLHDDFESSLEDFREAIDAGQTKKALALFEKCQSKLHRLSDMGEDRKRIDKQSKRLLRLKPALDELKAWRSWGMGRAREELIGEVESLLNAEIAPKDLLVRIREARAQWNKWNQTGDYPNRILRQRFDEACKKAYAPCAEYLKQQKRLRASNLETRNQVCEELEDIFNTTNWNRPNWFEIGSAIRNARKSWKTAVPLNKSDWQASNERFDQVLRQYEPYLDRERERCYQYRLDLIDRVNALDSKPVRDAIETVKQIQQEWKNVTVRCSKQRENKLWEQFRHACDLQFNRRTAQREASKQHRQELAKLKKSLLDELKSINSSQTQHVRESKSRVAQIRQQWASIVRDSKKGGNKSIELAFDHEIANFQNKLRSAEHLERGRTLEVLERKSRLCVELENVVGRDDAAAQLDSIRSKWQNKNSDCGIYEADIRKRFTTVCEAIENGKTSLPSTSENLAAKKFICLQLEILTEIPSPPEFSRDRMEYQVNRLNAKMTKQDSGNKNPDRERQDLVAQFLITGAVPPDSCASLDERFARIRSQMKSNTPG